VRFVFLLCDTGKRKRDARPSILNKLTTHKIIFFLLTAFLISLRMKIVNENYLW
jgi:hypothetical protein